MKFLPKDEAALLFELSKIKGLDIEAGLEHLPDTGAWFAILRQFREEYDGYEQEIKTALESENWKNYTIRVHAMKGVFGTIGVDFLFQWARKLEFASREGDYELCRQETSALCGAMRAFKTSLEKTSLIEEETVAKSIAPSAQVKEKLTQLKDACMRGDSDEADEFAASLAEMSLNDAALDRRLDEICANARNLDYDVAIEKACALLANLPS
jgi:HPt (histidine-containing phosphotransfer) domain-containing protein